MRALRILTRSLTYVGLLALTMSAAPAQDAQVNLELVARFEHQVTGVTVAKDGRVFVNFPRWTEDTPISLAEVKDGQLVPFPNAQWNEWRNARKDELLPRDHWICVQSVVADARGNIWVIDPAAPAMDKVVENGPKLVEIDLQRNMVGRVIPFDETIAPQGSYLNDVRISPDGKTAYVTDSGARGAIVVVDLDSGRARRTLDGHASTMPDKSVVVTYDGQPLRRPDGRGVEFAADGIALSADGATLYWQAIRGKTLFSIPTSELTGTIASAVGAVLPPAAADKLIGKVAAAGENGPADGLLISRADGRMYITSPQDDSIKVRDLNQANAAPSIVVQDKRLRWPDTLAEAPDGTIYVTTSHIQDSAMYKKDAPTALPTELWRFKPTGARRTQ